MSVRDGILDDSAAELAAAARRIDPAAAVTAIVTGAGESLEQVCRAASALYPQAR